MHKNEARVLNDMRGALEDEAATHWKIPSVQRGQSRAYDSVSQLQVEETRVHKRHTRLDRNQSALHGEVFRVY